MESIPGWAVTDVFGIVTGMSVRSRNAISDFGSDVKSLIGGELHGATRMVLDARQQAQERMEDAARALGANAVLAVRYEQDSLGSGSSQSSATVVYGTAVTIEPIAADTTGKTQ